MSKQLNTSSNRLPDGWIQRIFATMQGHYGTRFLNMWKTGQVLSDGSDAGVVNAMNEWSRKLAGYADQPETIRKALQYLPHDPPSLPQFCELLRQSYKPIPVNALEHSMSPEEIERNKVRLKQVLSELKLKTIPSEDDI